MKQATTINVKFKPEVERPNTTHVIHAVEGEPLALACNFKANPTIGANTRWYKNGHLVEHPHQQAGILRLEAQTTSAGLYACSVENEVGRSDRVDIAHVFVEEKPQVTLYFEPRQPVSELMDANVTLMCSSNYNRDVVNNANAITGNNFIAVKWYLDGDLLKQVDRSPECLVPKRNVSNCNVDPSKVMLLNVKRSFWGNYSCQAQNRAGWGTVSEPKEMKVLYPPDGTTISYTPEVVIKGKPFEVSYHIYLLLILKVSQL